MFSLNVLVLKLQVDEIKFAFLSLKRINQYFVTKMLTFKRRVYIFKTIFMK